MTRRKDSPVVVQTLAPSNPIESWSSIAAYISIHTGLSVSLDTAQRWSKRSHDPLPVRRWGKERPRVVAERAELDAWIARQWRGGA